MSLLAARVAIAAAFDEAIDHVHVYEHGGAFGLDDINRYAKKSPAVVIACLGVPRIELQGMTVVAHATWAAFPLAANAAASLRDAACLTLAGNVMVEIPPQRWSNTTCTKATDISGQNLYSSKLDKKGVSIWAVTWSQGVELARNTIATLPDFKTFFSEWDVSVDGQDDTDTTTDLVEDLDA